MVAKRIAVQKAFGVSQNKRTDCCRNHCTVGIHHAFIDTQCRFFCFDRLLNLFFNRDVPRMEEIKLTKEQLLQYPDLKTITVKIERE